MVLSSPAVRSSVVEWSPQASGRGSADFDQAYVLLQLAINRCARLTEPFEVCRRWGSNSIESCPRSVFSTDLCQQGTLLVPISSLEVNTADWSGAQTLVVNANILQKAMLVLCNRKPSLSALDATQEVR